MISEQEKHLVESIKNGDIDVNNQSLFFSILLKGLLQKLNQDLTIRGKNIPVFILHTGDDTMYLSVKGQDASIEPREISNEDYVYNQIPRGIVQPKNIDLQTDQLTSPYATGQLQMTYEGGLYTLSGEVRRIPLKMMVDVNFYVDSYTDSLELSQQIISRLAFIQMFKIAYLGQTILCSYSIPTSYQEEHLMELDGTTTDNKARKISLSLEIETTYPVWQNRTIVSASQWISNTSGILGISPTGAVEKAKEGYQTVYEGGLGLVIESRQVTNKPRS